MRTLKEIIPSTEAQLSKEMKWKVSSIITYFESEIRQAYAKNRNSCYILLDTTSSFDREAIEEAKTEIEAAGYQVKITKLMLLSNSVKMKVKW